MYNDYCAMSVDNFFMWTPFLAGIAIVVLVLFMKYGAIPNFRKELPQQHPFKYWVSVAGITEFIIFATFMAWLLFYESIECPDFTPKNISDMLITKIIGVISCIQISISGNLYQDYESQPQ